MLVLIAACSDPADAETVTTTGAAQETTTVVATTSTAVPVDPTTTTTTISTTTTNVPPATTTTLPPLDRTDEATTVRLTEDLASLLLDRPRIGGSAAEAATVGALVREITALTGQRPRLEPVALPNGTTSANVWAPPLGDGPVEILLGGHIDTVAGSPGVDDNGSGTVVLLELMRRLYERPPEGITVTIVWFGSEEVLPGYNADDHHFGSRQAAARLADEDALPDWMVSVDMVGWGPRLLAVTYRDAAPDMAIALAEAGAGIDVEVTRLSRGDISDHEAFARVGVPAAMLWRPDNAAWHTPDDTQLDPVLLLEDLGVLEALLRLLENR